MHTKIHHTGNHNIEGIFPGVTEADHELREAMDHPDTKGAAVPLGTNIGAPQETNDGETLDNPQDLHTQITEKSIGNRERTTGKGIEKKTQTP